MNDTSPEIAKLVRDQLLARTGSERMQMASRMFDVARKIALASFPPGLSEVEKKVLLCSRFYEGEVDIQGFKQHLIRMIEAD